MERRRNPYVYISGVFAAAWALAAWFRPEADFIFFPILVGGSFPMSYRLAVGPLPPGFAVGAGIAGLINVVVVALFLAIAGVLGPASLIPGLGPVGQATLLGAIGAGLGYVLSTIKRSGDGRPRG